VSSTPIAAPAAAPSDAAEESGADPRLADWMARHTAELRRHVGRMLRSDDDADDVLQHVWLAAARRPPDRLPGSNVRAWLFRTATNAALDRLASDRRRRALLAGVAAARLYEPQPGPEEPLLALDERARHRIRARLAALPRRQREAVWLRWVEGDDYAAIAGKLGCSQESARANVYQGLKRLRRELFDLWQRERGA
jgi:RNA polymerase sigma factor (sigma-70 family)